MSEEGVFMTSGGGAEHYRSMTDYNEHRQHQQPKKGANRWNGDDVGNAAKVPSGSTTNDDEDNEDNKDINQVDEEATIVISHLRMRQDFYRLCRRCFFCCCPTSRRSSSRLKMPELLVRQGVTEQLWHDFVDDLDGKLLVLAILDFSLFLVFVVTTLYLLTNRDGNADASSTSNSNNNNNGYEGSSSWGASQVFFLLLLVLVGLVMFFLFRVVIPYLWNSVMSLAVDKLVLGRLIKDWQGRFAPYGVELNSSTVLEEKEMPNCCYPPMKKKCLRFRRLQHYTSPAATLCPPVAREEVV